MAKVVNYLLAAFYSGKPSIILSLDISAAFDMLTHFHTRLLKRATEVFGLTDQVINWLKSYITDCSNYVTLGNCHPTTCTTEVPQGSILGPLLFLIYINDIDVSVCAKLLKFANDMKVFSIVSTKNDIDRL